MSAEFTIPVPKQSVDTFTEIMQVLTAHIREAMVLYPEQTSVTIYSHDIPLHIRVRFIHEFFSSHKTSPDDGMTITSATWGKIINAFADVSPQYVIINHLRFNDAARNAISQGHNIRVVTVSWG